MGGSAGLDDTDLFARYWIDEGSTGDATGILIDSAPNPQPLTLVQQSGTAMIWVEPVADQRGIDWDAAQLGGRAITPAETTKFNQLYGRDSLTVEVVATHVGSPSWHARLFELGDESTASALQLSRPASGDLVLYLNEVGYHHWTVPQDQRMVLHLVLDTTLGNGDDRARLFGDGSPLPLALAAPLPANETIAVELDPEPDSFVIGNTSGGTRSWIGAIHYLAIYTTAFTAQRAADHAAVLANVDDAP